MLTFIYLAESQAVLSRAAMNTHTHLQKLPSTTPVWSVGGHWAAPLEQLVVSEFQLKPPLPNMPLVIPPGVQE